VVSQDSAPREVMALARNIRGSTKKVQLVVDTVRGKRVEDAVNILRVLPSPQALKVLKVVKSAAANAENNFQMDPARLRIVKAAAEAGPTLRRMRARARGRANMIRKPTCHIRVVVAEEED